MNVKHANNASIMAAQNNSQPIELLLGNEAIGLGLVENGCRVATAYPGTPSSEVLQGVIRFKKHYGRDVYTEWSVNEKVAFEVALAVSWSGLRSSVAMKQVGLNVAADPLFSAAYTGVEGGFIVISADDPGPHSSQTEQDSRMIAMTAKVPVLDPSTPREAYMMVGEAYRISEKYKVPVILRPTTRLCHAVQDIQLPTEILFNDLGNGNKFQRQPTRWTATPKFRYLLHEELNQKIIEIQEENVNDDFYSNYHPSSNPSVGIISSGVVFQTAMQALIDLNVQLPVLKIAMPYPISQSRVSEFIQSLDVVLILEEPDVCIELQLPERQKVRGRLDGTVPGAGELTPEIVSSIIDGLLTQEGVQTQPIPIDREMEETLNSIELPVRKPRLCPGCGHRSAFFTIKKEFGPKAIYPGDIGCYTLGMNLRAVDTFVDMGGSITMANGFFQASKINQDTRPIIATIGDSTFLHSGIEPLINAVHTGARFILVILDNHTTAMTGFQPTAVNKTLADGRDAAHTASIIDLVRACGVDFIKTADPYDHEEFQAYLKQADEHTKKDTGGVAIIISDRPCILYDPDFAADRQIPVMVTEECDGCKYCLEVFECPGLSLTPDGDRVEIDVRLCVNCGQCVYACYKGFIVPVNIE